MLKDMSGRNFCPHFPLVLIVAMVAVVLLWPGQALAEDLVADCSTDNLQDVIDSFQDKTVFNTLMIKGTCINPGVTRSCGVPGPEDPSK